MKIEEHLSIHHVKAILQVIVYLESHIDKPLLLSEMAKMAHISPYHFHRLFKAYSSLTPREYIKRNRFVRSAVQLQYSQIPITEIAFSMGFEDLPSFSRAFLQLAGKSPSLYRQEKQKQFLQIEIPKLLPKPEYVYREEETVLFLRKTGDYRETVIKGIQECGQIFRPMRRCYGMALDDPTITPRGDCRFDICVTMHSSLPHLGRFGQKKILGGKYVVFSHAGPFFSLEEVFTRYFFLWHSREKLRFSGSFCEYIDLPCELNLHTPITAKYYIPILV